MTQKFSKIANIFAVAAISLSGFAAPAAAQEQATQRAEIYTPGIWIDPDGCEHWVMDDGAEGYMSPHRTRDGRPVCHPSQICKTVSTDALFATGRFEISRETETNLREFFRTNDSAGYRIYGHTDSRASDAYNIQLSNNRAAAVARVAQDAGARVVDVKGFGERQPRATNNTAAGMQQNRRVEIYCVR